MVVREEIDGAEAGYLCIPQSQHAALAGQIARAWGNLEFPVPKPEHSVCLAAARHDDGMEPFDSDPEPDPDTGLPRDFMHMPLELWLECWRRGPRSVGEDDPYAGLLVSMHGLHLLGYRRAAGEEEGEAARLIREFEAEQEELQGTLRDRSAANPSCEPYLKDDVLESNRKLIEVWDAMSLALCMPRLPETFEGVPRESEPGSLRFEQVDPGAGGELLVEVEPWPFSASSVPLALSGRRLDGPPGEGVELAEALERAEVVTLDLTLLPREDPDEHRSGPPELPV